ncbi:single-stranded DNA-binding protein [Candidatus Uhrbacteria bacterium]|nr:single-stranded DNA-binding protein [Candidatus Uhrbacteria bacterium]
MNLNRAMIIGNLTRDPELRTTANGQQVATFGVATNRQWTNQAGQRQEQVEYHNIVAWGRLAEICHQYLGKGRKIYVEGRLQTREWEGQDGNKRQRTEIIVENMIMLDRAPQGSASAAAAPASISESEAGIEPPTTAKEEEIKLEDIPF